MFKKHNQKAFKTGSVAGIPSEPRENPSSAKEWREQVIDSALFTPGALDQIQNQVHELSQGLPNLGVIMQDILADTLELQLLYDEIDGVLTYQTDAIDRFLGLMNRVIPPGKEMARPFDVRDWIGYKPRAEPPDHDSRSFILPQRYGDLFLAAYVAAGPDHALRERLFRGIELLAFRASDAEALYRAAIEGTDVDRFTRTAHLLARDRGFRGGGTSLPDGGRASFTAPLSGSDRGVPDAREFTRLYSISEISGALRQVGKLFPTTSWADTIHAIEPTRACVGEQVTIKGKGFGYTQPSDIAVLFPTDYGCTDATVVSWSNYEIVVLVPERARSGCIGFYSPKALSETNSVENSINEALDALESSLASLNVGSGRQIRRLLPTLKPPCPPCTGRNGFEGTSPEIAHFGANGAQSLRVDPGSSVKLSWSVGNGKFLLDRTSPEGPPLSRGIIGPNSGSITLPPMTPTDHLATVTYVLKGINQCGSISRQVNIEVRRRPDLIAQGLEVTQATQFFHSNQHLSVETQENDNVVPLIEHKRTLVRLYVDSGLEGFDLGDGIGVVKGVSCRLWGWSWSSGNIPLPGTPLSPLNGPIIARHNDAYLDTRKDWDRTLNFELPSGWLTGIVALSAEVFADPPVEETSQTNNKFVTLIEFSEARKLKLRCVRIHYTGWQQTSAGMRSRVDIAAPPLNGLLTAANWLRRTYPINSVRIFTAPGNEIIDFDGDLTDVSGGGCGTGWNSLMSRLKQLASDYSDDEDAVWVGLLPTGWAGSASGGCGGGASDTIGVAVIFANDNGTTLAQEVGHAYGRKHAPGDPGCVAANEDLNYPAYGKARKGSIGEFGVDVPPAGSTAWVIKDPTSTSDFMGYCGPKWVSPYTYRALYNGGLSPSSSLPAGEGQGGDIAPDSPREVLILQGRIFRNGKVELEPGFHYLRMFRAPRGMSTGYDLEILDGDGTPLEIIPILAEDPEMDRAAGFDFTVEVVLPPRARQLRIVQGDREVLLRTIKEAAPKISRVRVRPIAGSKRDDENTESNQLQITWTVPTLDQPLWYKVRYSPDGGVHWMGVVPQTQEQKVTLDVTTLPGGENCLVEVYASDGLATGRARSDPFVVPHKPPRLVIGDPQRNTGTRDGALVLLGAGFDEQGRALVDDNLIWMSDIDGELGTGPVLEVLLSPGQHQISLSGRDDEGREGTTSIEVNI